MFGISGSSLGGAFLTGGASLAQGTGISHGLETLFGISQGQDVSQFARGLMDPNTAMYQSMLAQLMQDPSSVTKLPGYQASLDQATQQLLRTQAQTGLTGSGQQAEALSWLAPQMQSQWFNQYAGLLGNLRADPSTQAAMSGVAAGGQMQQQGWGNVLGFIGGAARSMFGGGGGGFMGGPG